MLEKFVTKVTADDLVTKDFLEFVEENKYLVKTENLDLSKTTGTFYCNSNLLVYEASRDGITVTIPQ